MHICCAPCSIYPVKTLRSEGIEVTGFFYKANIHPYTECVKRQNALKDYSSAVKLDVMYQESYDLEGFLQKLAFRELNRCSICYVERLRTTVLLAVEGSFDAFTTTLLYSKFQKHDEIRSLGEAIGNQHGIPFYYTDFRIGWEEGVKTSKQLGIYRQPYCGCIYSEKERYLGFRKK